MDQVAGRKTRRRTLSRGQVFLGPTATVHWHFYKKDCRATAKDTDRVVEEREREGELE